MTYMTFIIYLQLFMFIVVSQNLRKYLHDILSLTLYFIVILIFSMNLFAKNNANLPNISKMFICFNFFFFWKKYAKDNNKINIIRKKRVVCINFFIFFFQN